MSVLTHHKVQANIQLILLAEDTFGYPGDHDVFAQGFPFLPSQVQQGDYHH